MSDNPFAEPGDDESTVIRPIPGGRGAGPTNPVPPPTIAEAAAGVPAAPETRAEFAELPSIGASPIVAAAAPLLSLVARLRNAFSVPDPASLRESAIQEMRRFEKALRDQSLPMEQIRLSHYALCASLDDVVQNTPWGSRGPWADASLVSTFHQEVRSGERFFDLLEQLRQNLGTFLPVVELMYLCMSLGMQGRYRLSARGPAELDRVREETYVAIMRQRRPVERGLSIHWRGVTAPYRQMRSFPVWLAALLATGLLVLIYALLAYSINRSSDRLFDAARSLPPTHMPIITRTAPPKPVPPTPGPPGELDKLADFLDPEVKEGLVTVAGTDAVPIVRILNLGMFRSGSAVVEQKFLPVLARIGQSLRAEPGHVDVVGYTDNQPIHTVKFPSNFQLSQARAQAAAAVISNAIDDPSRLSTHGRADEDPIASNDTPDGRQQNRRIEVVLHRKSPD
ncbi:type VI secretion system protein TssL [Rhizobium sp. P32RR-XVIII]|uniref:type VI secretion system protein TssL, long form n=1 Tax=Rhizobium sp. P32RR-XVIII TaxID=2726738 RepID=UPI0014570912|nr:type VI secretion system protein TssL, long form [Rhizobium sp. P32RR-XVIII]NLS07982.1 type VI secretion system protein TssL [Rhizobium sp. P32RR-XVIII]